MESLQLCMLFLELTTNSIGTGDTQINGTERELF